MIVSVKSNLLHSSVLINGGTREASAAGAKIFLSMDAQPHSEEITTKTIEYLIILIW